MAVNVTLPVIVAAAGTAEVRSSAGVYVRLVRTLPPDAQTYVAVVDSRGEADFGDVESGTDRKSVV